MNATTYSKRIITNLEQKGESKDFIIGFMAAAIDGLRHLDDKKVNEYLEKTALQAQRDRF